VHPLVARLCGPIEGTDHAHLAECLGLDSAKYHSATHSREQGFEEQDATLLTMDDDARFQVPLVLSYHCVSLLLQFSPLTLYGEHPTSDIRNAAVDDARHSILLVNAKFPANTVQRVSTAWNSAQLRLCLLILTI
jgi:hypothetical protein